jgi:uroporphyrin-III C-methyltransferase/precorrin-2 dehydrogenase/sirohydrochlorin ferrochelatase
MRPLVSLVGAGPGDPELLTLRGARRLAQADLVLYDALVAPEMLDLAPRARRFFVGRRAGRPGIGQEAINALLIRSARRGQRVVRLKCGDPFVFGRGEEEVLALSAAGVPVEVVPGVSAALVAPSLAGIPLTHRGLSSAFVVVSGHAPDAYGTVFDGLTPDSVTLVVLMGLGARRQIAARLIARGWRRDTPAAIVVGAATPGQRVWTGPLAGLASASLPPGAGDSPGTIVVGAVVSLRRLAATLLADARKPRAEEGEAVHVGAR